MKSYEELRNELFEEVSKIEVSKLALGGIQNTLKDYAELLKTLSTLPLENIYESEESGFRMCCTVSIPKSEESEGK